jgi:hypothetical protein
MGVEFTRGEIWKPCAVVDRNVFTGQNPASAAPLVQEFMKKLSQWTVSHSLGPSAESRWPATAQRLTPLVAGSLRLRAQPSPGAAENTPIGHGSVRRAERAPSRKHPEVRQVLAVKDARHGRRGMPATHPELLRLS